MVRDDQRNFAAQLSAAVTIQQIDEAVVVLRNHHDHARAMIGVGEPPLHLELFSHWGKMAREISEVDVKFGGIKFHPHQEKIRLVIAMLIGVQNVAAVAEYELGNRGDYAFLIGARQQQDGRRLHE